MARWETVTDVLDHPLDPLDVEPPGPPGEGWPPEAHEVSTSSRWPTARRRRNFSHWEWAERIATIVVVAGCVLYTLAQLHPDLILKNTTPAGGDMGAHVWGPAYLRDHILP